MLREIASEFGVAVSTVSEWLQDPDGSRLRARKDSYRGHCESCGARTDGSSGSAAAPTQCNECRLARLHAERYWTRERIIEWIRIYVEACGQVPPSTVQNRQTLPPRGLPAAPTTAATSREFGPGGWRIAVRTAGFEPYRDSPLSGHKLGAGHPKVQEMLDLRAAGVPVAVIAERQGVTDHAIYLRLRRYGGAGEQRVAA